MTDPAPNKSQAPDRSPAEDGAPVTARPTTEQAWRDLAEADWKRILNAEQFRIARKSGTERPFSGHYWKNGPAEGKGVYKCVACMTPLFANTDKFFSACGWPAFKDDVKGKVSEHADNSHGMVRVEVRCQTCSSHLGHVFNDGPPPTGLRYCINSASIVHDPEGTINDAPLTPEQRASLGELSSEH